MPDIEVVVSPLNIDVQVGTAMDYLAMLNSSVQYLMSIGRVYDSDLSAEANGVPVGEVYIAAFNHLSAAPGTILVRME